MNVIVKLPNDINEKLLSFPFLTALDELLAMLAKEDPEDDTYQIHLISTKEGIDVLNLLPFHAYYHEIESEDLKTIFSAHRATKTFNITNRLDKYISTTYSFVDASLGKNLGIKDKIGFAVGKNAWMLNNKITPPETKKHKSEELFNLFKAFKTETPNILNVSSRRLEPIYLDWSENPYTVIDLDLIDGEVNPQWEELFDLTANKRFVLMCSELGEHLQEDKIAEYVGKLPGKNTYKFFKYDSNIEFGKLVSYCSNIVTKNIHLMTISAYCSAYVHFINEGNDLKYTSPKYFRGEVIDFKVPKGKSAQYNLVFDAILELIEKKSEVDTEENQSDIESE